MARQEQDRDDLMRDATALVERVELFLPGRSEPIVAGFRRDGAPSLYFGQEPVYQFNAVRQLRRAFVAGLIYKAERGGLVSLRRERSAEQVDLVRHELNAAETAEFLASLAERLSNLRAALDDGRLQVGRQVPAAANVPSRLRGWLAGLPNAIELAASLR